MNNLILEKRVKPAAITVFVLVLAACGTLATLPKFRLSVAEESITHSAVVQDNQVESSLDVKLFLHRQGFVAQPADGAGQ
jgi:uncharacterized lipoprotein YmbA